MNTPNTIKAACAAKKPKYVMIGGFLGAGKTTAVGKLAAWLAAKGLRAGLITNDQGRYLVDTTMLRAQGFATEEIPGGCFCCRFNSLVDAVQKLHSETLASEVQKRLRHQKGEIAHLKMTLKGDRDSRAVAGANLVRNDSVPELSLQLQKSVTNAQLTINLRVEAAPHILGAAMREGLIASAAAFPNLSATLDHLEHFRPGKPTPTHRITRLTA
jgi:hypothetical protein